MEWKVWLVPTRILTTGRSITQFIYVQEITGGVSYNAALQWSQIFFSQKVFRLQANVDSGTASPVVAPLYMLLWSLFLFLIGASQLLLNIIVCSARGGSRYREPVSPPAGPFFVAVSGSGISAGCVLTLVGVFSMIRATSYLLASPSRFFQSPFYPKVMVLLFLVQIALQNVGQAGYATSPGAGTTYGACMVGLMFAVAFMPAYLDWLIREQFEDYENSSQTENELLDSVIAKPEHAKDKHVP
ncbi:hypothetical protein KFL_000290460 [Klebsormidium nitens]|uniref:Uncharacterized protein n=1 Tax=Klebsormidium nitens TaxID=105231 RepID=A0A1Y1HS52_KLENI|nr:hypothetical protein KFL_000290460 [Klebsormidium nitens]|eukprot:GAQ79396.1 hypothetical protein KFL_000290460 [Klebsormidium nitens]